MPKSSPFHINYRLCSTFLSHPGLLVSSALYACEGIRAACLLHAAVANHGERLRQGAVRQVNTEQCLPELTQSNAPDAEHYYNFTNTTHVFR
jgi:hypothetical protein